MNICQALRILPDSRIAWVGAGGKTTSMFRAARQFGGKIIVSATAHLAVEQMRLADCYFVISSMNDFANLEAKLVDGINLIVGRENPPGRMQGLDDQQITRIKEIAERSNIPILIEADGARLRPIKAPAEHEPPIPPWVDSVVVVAGLSAIGHKLDEQSVFRPETFANLAHTAIGSEIRLDDLCAVLLDPCGGLKNIPELAEKIVLFNQSDATRAGFAKIQSFKDELLSSYHSVIIASMQSVNEEVQARFENIAGIILAAGNSERFGQPKQLLDWKGKPFIRQVTETAINGGLKPVVVVVGAVIEPIIEVLRGLAVEIVINHDWPSGLSASIRSGIKHIENHSRGAVFLMSDMPQMSSQLIQMYLSFQSVNDYHILVPRVNSQKTNPAMFDARCFRALMSLEGDFGGRLLFDKFPVTWIDLDDKLMSIDVDTPDDYQLMKKLSADDDEG